MRLWERLAAADLPYDDLVLVLEGAARRGVPAGRSGRVVTVHARGSGDDAIVEEVAVRSGEGWDVTGVTADRELRGRIEAAGGAVVGPSWLLERFSPIRDY